MGAEGFSNSPVPVDFETNIVSGCTAKTKQITNPFSVWPSICNPDGMALFLNAFSPPNPPGEPAVHWITIKSTDQATVINEVIRGLRDFGSPGIVPVYGQADHWVAIDQVTTNSAGAVSNVRAFDGGKIGGMDSGTNSYFVGHQSWSGIAFRNTFFVIVTAINPSCDNVLPNGCGSPPVNDPFAMKFVLMYEPPQSGGTRAFRPLPVTFAATPGLVGKGGMNANLASSRLMDALIAGGINADPTMWNGLKGGTPGGAFLVQGLWPSGAPNNFYLVPVLSPTNTHTAIGFAQLSADDGSFLGVNLLTTPVAFNPVALTRAQEIAASTLGSGESLTGGGLTWNPRSPSAFSKSANEPYYEFAVSSGGTVQVRLNDGAVARQ
jgi:hypothetical protein